MTKIAIVLALIALLSPFANTQFNSNFTQMQIGWGPRAIQVVPSNLTFPDGQKYFIIEREPIDEPEGEWTFNLLNADGSTSEFADINNDLVVINPDGSATSVAASIPSVAGIRGPGLVRVMENNAKQAIDYSYANPDVHTVTQAQANTNGYNAVNQVLATSSLPSFFLGPFRTQANNQVTQSLANALIVSAAINASIIASQQNQTNNNETTIPVGPTQSLEGNLTTFDISLIHDVKEYFVSYGADSVDVVLAGEVSTVADDQYGSYLVNLTSFDGESTSTEWGFSWIDDDNELFALANINGKINVVNPDGSLDDYSVEAGWFGDLAAGQDLDEVIGNSIKEFVDEVISHQSEIAGPIVVNVGPEGLNWTLPAANATA